MKTKIGLFFGSFNPIHIGHLIIADYFASATDLNQVWFVVSPQNPFKNKENLLDEYTRLHLVNLSVENNPKLFSCDIEFSLPKPSYTIDTLIYLQEKYPDFEFSLIMGSDNLLQLHKWKNYSAILSAFSIYVYERPNSLGCEPLPILKEGNFIIEKLPLLDISATFIRNAIKSGISVQYMLTKDVYKYIDEMNLYKR